ncbi:MAG TPA: hypothetical protein VGH98_18720 [Gemmatimonadaceae bacterium]|jgi:hypothetical protein
MRPLALGTLVLLTAATSASAQLAYVTQAPPRVDVIPSDAWLCRQIATNLDESTLLGTAILGRLENASPTEWSEPIRFTHSDNRLGEAIAAFAIDGTGGVIYVSDTLDGSTLLHEGTHAMMLRLTPEDARREMTRVLAADSAGQIDPDIVDLARRSFTLSFTASANPDLWSLVPMVLTTAAFSDRSHAGTLARLVHASDSAAVRLEGNVSKGWGRATIADAYDVAASSHWRYAGFARPASWTWQDERTFRLIGEAVAYERARHCALGS